MKVLVKGYFHLQKAMGGQRLVEVVEDGILTIRSLLDNLCHKHGKELSELLFEPETEELLSHLMLLVNGHNYLHLPEKLDTRLKDGDEIAIFPPIAGG